MEIIRDLVRRGARAYLLCFSMAVCLLPPAPAEGASPKFEITSQPAFAGVARKIEAVGREDFTSSLVLTGRMGFQRPIRILLFSEDQRVARETPKWVSGYARGDRSLIVLFPERVPSYPDRNFRSLLHHEVTHILVWEASGGRAVPRWFNEGVATVAAREWGLEDRARYAAAVIGRSPRTLYQLDRAFSGNGADISRAYALSAAMIRFIRNKYGPFIPAEVLQGVARGLSFQEAYEEATGERLDQLEERFLRNQRPWTVWLPFVSSTTTLWMLVSLLALAAILWRQVGKKARFEALDIIEDPGEEDPPVGPRLPFPGGPRLRSGS